MEKNQEDNDRGIELVKKELFKIFEDNSKKSYKFFIDLLPVGKIRYSFSRKIRGIAIQIAVHKQLEMAAFITQSLFVKTVIGFIVGVAGRKENIKLFLNKKKAFEWLKG